MNLGSRRRLDRAVLINAAIRQALCSESIEPIQPQCHGTRCDWPSYSSLAFYHVCEDAIDDARLILRHGDTDLFRAYQNNSGLEDLNETNWASPLLFSSSRATAYSISLGQGADFPFNVNLETQASTQFAESTILVPQSVVWDLGGDARTKYADWQNHTPAPDSGEQDTAIYWSNASTINGINGPLKALGHVEMEVTNERDRLVITSAQRCVFTLSAQQYSTKVEDGKLDLKTVQTDVGRFVVNLTSNPGGGLDWHAQIGDTTFYSAFTDTGDYAGYSTLQDYYIALTGLEGTLSMQYAKQILQVHSDRPSVGSVQTSVTNDVR